MTGRAEGCVLRPGPGNIAADGITVTSITAWIVSVIARVIPLCVMAEAGRCPAVGGMTHIALRGGG